MNIRALPLILAGVAFVCGARAKAGDTKPFSFFENRGGHDVSLTVQKPGVRGATVTLNGGDSLQMDLCNRDVDARGGLGQVVLGQPGFGGVCSLWFTKPVCTAANPTYLSDTSGISSLFHEMGHNSTLNSPARYRFGGKSDGRMSPIVSETLAQIMQHATAYELLNRPAQYGLPANITEAIRRSAQDTFGVTSRAYLEYVAKGCPYSTVQRGEPGEPDRAFGTFMAVAYEFVRMADERRDFRKPLQRTMALLQTFNERDHQRFQARETEAFRGSLMVAAVSCGFNTDVRPTFRHLRFPVDNGIYRELIEPMPGRVNFVL